MTDGYEQDDVDLVDVYYTDNNINMSAEEIYDMLGCDKIEE